MRNINTIQDTELAKNVSILIKNYKNKFLNSLKKERSQKITSNMTSDLPSQNSKLLGEVEMRKNQKIITYVTCREDEKERFIVYDVYLAFSPSSNSVVHSIPYQVYWTLNQIKNSCDNWINSSIEVEIVNSRKRTLANKLTGSDPYDIILEIVKIA